MVAQVAQRGQDQTGLLALQGDLSAQDSKHQEYAAQLNDITNKLTASGLTDQVRMALFIFFAHAALATR